MAHISCKGKKRVILLPDSLIRLLKAYCKERKLRRGSIFITRNGRPVDRRSIWKEMKELCREAGIQATKVFPHNLRHLFAKCYYEKERDLVRLADYLGHSSIETTRRYTMITSMEACLRQLNWGFWWKRGGKRKNLSIMALRFASMVISLIPTTHSQRRIYKMVATRLQ